MGTGASPTVAALGQVLLIGVSKDYWPRVTRHYSFSKEAVHSRFYIKSFEMLASTSFCFFKILYRPHKMQCALAGFHRGATSLQPLVAIFLDISF